MIVDEARVEAGMVLGEGVAFAMAEREAIAPRPIGVERTGDATIDVDEAVIAGRQ